MSTFSLERPESSPSADARYSTELELGQRVPFRRPLLRDIGSRRTCATEEEMTQLQMIILLNEQLV